MMTKRIECLRAAAVVLSAVVAMNSFVVPHAAAAETQAKPPAEDKVSAKVAKSLKAAQEFMKKEQWEQALPKIEEADAASDKTPYDQYMINEFKGNAFLGLKRYAEAATVYEQNVNSPKVPPAEVNDRLLRLVQLYNHTQNWPKVTEYGSRWLKAGNKDADIQFYIGQAYYQMKDYSNAASTLETYVKVAQEAGKKPEKNGLAMIQSSYVKLGNNEAAVQTLEQLVTYYPEPQYWEVLLSQRLGKKNSDKVTLNLYRLSYHLGVMKSPEEYLETTELLLDAGLPGEAKSVMEAGYQAKAFETADKARADRYARQLSEAKAAAAKDQQSLPGIEKEAQKAGTGQSEVALGLAYWSFGQYDKAVAALAQGLQKGGVRDPDQAEMCLGMSHVKLGHSQDAIKAFSEVKADPQMADVARLWSIVAKSGTG